MARFALALAATLACSTSAFAQQAAPAPAADAKPEKWDVNAPPGMTTRKIPIGVDEGSWMNVDVAPDGRTIWYVTAYDDVATVLKDDARFCKDPLAARDGGARTVSYTHLRAHETVLDLVCRLLLEKKKTTTHSTHTDTHSTYINHTTTNNM